MPEGQKSVALTDLEFLEESVGWRRPMRDRVPIENGGTCFLEAGGRFAERGLYAHAPSRYVVRIDKAWKRLNTSFGLQAGHPGSVVFVVRGDGRELFRSEVITDQKLHSTDLDVSGVDTLVLIVENGGNGNGGDWGVWLEPTLMALVPTSHLSCRIWRSMWRFIRLILYDHYPPRVYVFFPLYRVFRRRWKIPMAVSNLLVWTASAVLHGGVLSMVGSPHAGLVFASVFTGLGILATAIILVTKPTASHVRARLAKA